MLENTVYIYINGACFVSFSIACFSFRMTSLLCFTLSPQNQYLPWYGVSRLLHAVTFQVHIVLQLLSGQQLMLDLRGHFSESLST